MPSIGRQVQKLNVTRVFANKARFFLKATPLRYNFRPSTGLASSLSIGGHGPRWIFFNATAALLRLVLKMNAPKLLREKFRVASRAVEILE